VNTQKKTSFSLAHKNKAARFLFLFYIFLRASKNRIEREKKMKIKTFAEAHETEKICWHSTV
jgi:hypothetical protein